MKKLLALMMAVMIAMMAIVPVALADHDDDDDSVYEDLNDDDIRELVAGGWTANTDDITTIPDGVKTAFEDAIADLPGYTLQPVAFLGTQVVNGTNYLVLCYYAEKGVYVTVTVHEDLNGNASVLDVDLIDPDNDNH